jgi:hypothetical protein
MHDGYTVLWTLFVVVWLLAAFGAKRAIRRQSIKAGCVKGLWSRLVFSCCSGPGSWGR